MKAIVKSRELELEFGAPIGLWRTGSGLPVVCLHGWLDNANSFLPLVQALADRIDGLEYISADFWGHGHSAHRSRDSRQYFTDLVWFVQSLLDKLQLERVCLLGHSMGAGAASLFAGSFPERVSHLILLDGLGPLSAPAAETPERLRKALEADPLNQGGRIARKGPRVFPDIESAARIRQQRTKVSLAAARLLVERGMRAASEIPALGRTDGFVWRHDPRLNEPSMLRLTEEQVLAFLQGIKARTILVQAENEQSHHFQQLFAGRLQAIANLELRPIQGSHHCHMEQPEAVTDLILPVLADYLNHAIE
ncbi:MAG: alpha/beta hydrolase [Leptospiraceae bacterium]|nr:alpha/beta hydrolase [Leptospiraceae bacterium]